MESKSSFQFEGYRVKKAILEINKISGDELDVKFDVSGELNIPKKKFFLSLKTEISDVSRDINFEVEFEGKFSITSEKVEINDFILINAPAILFPYIRAYITTMTSLSGIKPMILPTLNLTSLKSELEDKIVIVK